MCCKTGRRCLAGLELEAPGQPAQPHPPEAQAVATGLQHSIPILWNVASNICMVSPSAIYSVASESPHGAVAGLTLAGTVSHYIVIGHAADGAADT